MDATYGKERSDSSEQSQSQSGHAIFKNQDIRQKNIPASFSQPSDIVMHWLPQKYPVHRDKTPKRVRYGSQTFHNCKRLRI